MLKEVLDTIDLIDGCVTGKDVAEYFASKGIHDVTVTPIDGDGGHTDFIRVFFPGSSGRSSGGTVSTLGIIGRLGGVGARPARIGMVSDADGAVAALSAALKIGRMRMRGDVLPGDVIINTHICPNAPVAPHEPVPFMGSPVDMAIINQHEVEDAMDAIITVDTTKGNYILNHRGIAVTPTVKEGYILPVSPALLDTLGYVTGRLPRTLPLSQFDITPYGNGLSHINSILQPATSTDAHVVGLAIVAESVIPGCATGASQETDIRDAALFCVETAKLMEKGAGIFYDKDDFDKIRRAYGDMRHFQLLRV